MYIDVLQILYKYFYSVKKYLWNLETFMALWNIRTPYVLITTKTVKCCIKISQIIVSFEVFVYVFVVLNKNSLGAKSMCLITEAAIIDQKVWYQAKTKKYYIVENTVAYCLSTLILIMVYGYVSMYV